MKCDMDLIRQILMEIEASPEADGTRDMTLNIAGSPEPEVMYHTKLLVDEGFIDARDASNLSGRKFYPRGLTRQGQEFLNAIRKDTHWEKIKGIAIRTTGGLGFEALKQAMHVVTG